MVLQTNAKVRLFDAFCPDEQHLTGEDGKDEDMDNSMVMLIMMVVLVWSVLA